MFNPRSLTSRAFIIPKGMTLGDCNRDDIRVIEMPASNGIGTARSVAKAYGSVATGGSDLGITPSTLDALTQPATPPAYGMRDKVLHIDTVFSLGYIKPFPKFVFGAVLKGIRNDGPRWFVRVRRSGYGYWIRLRNEQIGFSSVERSTGTRASPSPVPRHRGGQVANVSFTPRGVRR